MASLCQRPGQFQSGAVVAVAIIGTCTAPFDILARPHIPYEMHWKGGGGNPPPPTQGAQPMPSRCPPEVSANLDGTCNRH